MSKSHFILIVISFFISAVYGQIPEIEWDKKFGDTKHDEPRNIITTSDGNLLVLGYTQPKDRFDLDLLIMKIDPNGNLIWKKTYGTENNEIGLDAVELDNGEWFITSSISVNNKATNSWLLRIDKNGILLWDRVYNNLSNVYTKSIVKTNDNFILLAGVEDKKEVVNEELKIVPQALLIKLDLDGKVIWKKYFSEEFSPESLQELKNGSIWVQKGESANKVLLTKDNGIILVGHSLTKAKKDLATDAWLCKLDSTGTKLWSKTFGAVGGDDLLDVIEDDQGNLFVIGEQYDKPAHQVALWLTKFSKNGELLMEQIYLDRNECLKATGHFYNSNSIVIAGGNMWKDKDWIRTDKINDSIKDSLLNIGWQLKQSNEKEFLEIDYRETGSQKLDEDILIIGTDLQGVEKWRKIYGGDKDDMAISTCQLNGSIYITGYTYSNSIGLKDIFVLKLTGSVP